MWVNVCCRVVQCVLFSRCCNVCFGYFGKGWWQCVVCVSDGVNLVGQIVQQVVDVGFVMGFGIDLFDDYGVVQ